MGRLDSIAGILNFFVPADVLSSVLLVFTMENVLDHTFSALIPPEWEAKAWVLVYIIGVLAISSLNYVTADEEEREELSDDLDDL